MIVDQELRKEVFFLAKCLGKGFNNLARCLYTIGFETRTRDVFSVIWEDEALCEDFESKRRQPPKAITKGEKTQDSLNG